MSAEPARKTASPPSKRTEARAELGGGVRRSQRERREKAESRVLDATARLLAEGGSAMVTLAEVGHRAGYSRGIVTHHFGTKEALLGAFARVAQGHVRPPAEQEPGLEHLAAAVNAYLVQVRSGDPYVRGFLLLWVESVNAPPELRAIFSERDRFFVDQILGDLDAGVAAGTIAADVDLTTTAVALAAQLRGIGLQLIIDPESLDVDHTNEVVRRTLLGALENRNPQTKPRR